MIKDMPFQVIIKALVLLELMAGAICGTCVIGLDVDDSGDEDYGPHSRQPMGATQGTRPAQVRICCRLPAYWQSHSFNSVTQGTPYGRLLGFIHSLPSLSWLATINQGSRI
jgi:hypothetical protein